MTDAAPSRITELRQHEEELVFPAQGSVRSP